MKKTVLILSACLSAVAFVSWADSILEMDRDAVHRRIEDLQKGEFASVWKLKSTLNQVVDNHDFTIEEYSVFERGGAVYHLPRETRHRTVWNGWTKQYEDREEVVSEERTVRDEVLTYAEDIFYVFDSSGLVLWGRIDKTSGASVLETAISKDLSQKLVSGVIAPAYGEPLPPPKALPKGKKEPAATVPFLTLVKTGKSEEVSAAIAGGAQVNQKDEHGITPLMSAASGNSNPEVTAILLKAGARIDDKDEWGRTPLISAAFSNPNPEVITTLLKAGASLDDSLSWAAYSNSNPEVITTLLKAGAELDGALFSAAGHSSNPEIVTILLKAGAKLNDRNAEGWTPLIYAARANGNPEIILTLLKAGADGTLKSREGKTAYDCALENQGLSGSTALAALKAAAGK